jgi:hypothetical protein
MPGPRRPLGPPRDGEEDQRRDRDRVAECLHDHEGSPERLSVVRRLEGGDCAQMAASAFLSESPPVGAPLGD